MIECNTRIFNINNGSSVLNVTLDGLILTNGRSTGDGGAILNQENLTITNSNISGNSANRGGGIRSFSSLSSINIQNSTIENNQASRGGGVSSSNANTVNISNSKISGNSSSYNAGGIFNYQVGSVNIVDSTISSNTSNYGGGILNTRSTTVIKNTTISGNSAVGYAGGGFNYNSSTKISNSTISGNLSNSFGGGIFNTGGNTIQIKNSTISANSAGTTGGGLSNSGSTAIVTSTIIAKNVDNKDISGPFTSGGNNLIGNGDGGTGFINNVSGDKVGTTIAPIDPLLGVLQDNGGKTFTQALLPGSPAINAGSNPDSLLNDQRGTGFARSVGQTDIGAFEVQPTTLFAPFSFNQTVNGSFTSTVGAFTSTSNTSGSSLFQGTVSINSLTGVQNGVTFTSGFNAGNFLNIGTGVMP